MNKYILLIVLITTVFLAGCIGQTTQNVLTSDDVQILRGDWTEERKIASQQTYPNPDTGVYEKGCVLWKKLTFPPYEGENDKQAGAVIVMKCNKEHVGCKFHYLGQTSPSETNSSWGCPTELKSVEIAGNVYVYKSTPVDVCCSFYGSTEICKSVTIPPLCTE